MSDVRRAFGDAWTDLGIFMTAVSLFFLVARIINLGLAPIFLDAANLFHGIGFILFLLPEIWLQLSIPQGLKDLTTVYIIIGATSYRARRTELRILQTAFPPGVKLSGFSWWNFIANFLFWPMHVYHILTGESVQSYLVAEWKQEDPEWRRLVPTDEVVTLRMKRILFIQVVATLIAFSIIFLLNSSLGAPLI